MSDSMVRSIVLKLEGLEEVLKGVLAVAESTGELGQRELKDLSQGMETVSNMAGTLSSSLKEVPASLQAISDKAAEAQAMLKEMVAADILSGGQGKISTKDFLGNIPHELREAVTQLNNYLTSNVVAENLKAEKSFEKVTQATGVLAKAVQDSDYAESVRGMSSLERATSDYVQAQTELSNANAAAESTAKDATATADQRAQAILRVAKATEDASRAEDRLDREASKEMERQAKAAEELANAQGKLNQSMASSAFERQLEALTPLEQASRRYTQALQEQEVAKRNLDAAKGSDDELQRTREMEEAFKKAEQARARYNAEVKKGDDKKNKEHAKDVDNLIKAEERLQKAQEKTRKTIPQTGADSLKLAREMAKSATWELTKAEENYNRVLNDASSTLPQMTAATDQLTRAQENATQASQKYNTVAMQTVDAMPRLRYALYDVSRTLTRIGGGLLGVATSTGVVTTKMSRDFADVIRTTETFRDATGMSTRAMRKDFEDLYNSMPADWVDITRIGEMAGQMNIAASDVAHFTELVTKFSASTDVSVDSSATAFGRLSELLNVTADEYENLGSSILSVGVNSVATENQIIEISQQIAGIAGTAGLTADQVVGLSAALASIGTAPELSRGIVTRFFTNLMNATSQGGERLEKFAAVSGMTAEQFKRAWATDAAGAFQAVIRGLGQVEQSQAISVLRELGIQQVRDIPAVLKLSQNYELLARSMDIAADGYREGSALGDHYNVIAEEMSSKIHTLKNQFALLLDSLGAFTQTDFMKGLVDGVTRALELLTTLAKSPLGKALAVISVPIMGAVGAVGLFLAALASMKASQLAAHTSLAGLGQVLGIFSSRTEVAGMKVKQLNARLLETNAYSRAAGAALKGIGVGLAIGAITFAFAKLAEHLQSTKQRAEDMRTALAGMGEAFAIDTQTFEETGFAFNTIELKSWAAADGIDEAEAAFRQITGTSMGAASAFDHVTEAAEGATVAIGREVVLALTKSMLTQEDFVNSLKGGAVELRDYGFNLSNFIKELVSSDGDVVSLIDDIEARVERAKAERRDALIAAQLGQSAGVILADEFRGIDQAIQELKMQTTAYGDELSEVTLKETVLKAVTEELGLEVEDLEEKLARASESADTFKSVLTEWDTTAYDMQESMWNLAEALIKNGDVWDEFSEEGRANVKALETALGELWDMADGDAQAFAENIANAFAYVEGAGFNLAESTNVLDQVLDNTFGTEWRAHLDTTQAHQSIKSYIEAVVAALRARAQLERNAADSYMALARSSDDMVFADFYARQAEGLYAVADGIESQISAVQELGNQLSQAGSAGETAGRRIRDGLAGKGGGGSPAKKAAKDAKNLKEELYTLKNYASDLAEIWSRAFDIRFTGQKTLDAVTLSLRGIAERFRDAENRVRDLRIQLQTLQGDLTGLQAELSKQQYFLSIATEYGDTARAEQISARIAELQAELAKKQAEVADTSRDLSKAQEDTSRSLSGNSDAAIQNRSDLMDLVKQYQDHIKALAESGMSSKDLQIESEKLRQDFMAQARQLGFNSAELKKYENAFKDVKTAIDTVPRKITVTASTDPATQAVNEWIAKVNQKKATMGVDAKVSAPKSIAGGSWKPSSIGVGSGGMSTPKLSVNGTAYANRIEARNAWISKMLSIGGGAGAGRTMFMSRGGQTPQYLASGGIGGMHPGGPRGTDTVPAWLTPGEWVIKRQAVDYYGPQVMRAINDLKMPKRFFSATQTAQTPRQTAYTGVGGRQMFDLSPSSIQALATAVQPLLVMNNRVVAQANGADARAANNTGRN